MDIKNSKDLPKIKPDDWCDNLECRNRSKHPKLSWVRMSDEIEGGWFIWCDKCIEKDYNECDKLGRAVVEVKE